jgi:hypothetical protein
LDLSAELHDHYLSNQLSNYGPGNQGILVDDGGRKSASDLGISAGRSLVWNS